MRSNAHWAQRATRVTILFTLLLLTIFHVGVVAVYNSPNGNPIKMLVQPVLGRYAGPWLYQDWSLFAPEAPSFNTDVFIEGRTASGTLTSWYDVSRYFNVRANGRPFSREHYLAEALAHSADFVISPRVDDRRASRVVMGHIAVAVLRKYVTAPITAFRMEIDRHYLAPLSGTLSSKHKIEDKILPWTTVRDLE